MQPWVKCISDVQRYLWGHEQIRISHVLLHFPVFPIYSKEVLKLNKQNIGFVVLRYYCEGNYKSTWDGEIKVLF